MQCVESTGVFAVAYGAILRNACIHMHTHTQSTHVLYMCIDMHVDFMLCAQSRCQDTPVTETIVGAYGP